MTSDEIKQELERLQSGGARPIDLMAEIIGQRASLQTARAEIERLTAREQTLMRVCEELRRAHPGMTHAHVERLEALTVRLQTAEKAAHEWRERCEGMWSKAHVEAGFYEAPSLPSRFLSAVLACIPRLTVLRFCVWPNRSRPSTSPAWGA